MGHIVTVNLPEIGEGVIEGEVVQWLKQVGDSLAQDEPVVVVMTDKATVELPAPYPGKLAKQFHQPGQIAIRDQPLYEIEVEQEPSTAIVAPKLEQKCVQEMKAPTTQTPRSGSKALATPPVRKLAKDMAIDINTLRGTGKEGRVTAEDVKGRQQPQKDAVPHLQGDEEKPLIGIQGLMAKKMAESKRSIPHFSYHEKVDAVRLMKMRDHFKKEGLKENLQVTYLPFFIRALSLTIVKFPSINSCFDGAANKLILHKQQNVGIAMSTENGLIVTVLKDVQNQSLNEIIRNYDALRRKAQEGKLLPNDMKESTITISNFGALGEGLWATPIINYPEVAILAVNKIQKQPVVKNNTVIVKDILNLSWSFDHRVIDGNSAAAVSAYFSELLENPACLL